MHLRDTLHLTWILLTVLAMTLAAGRVTAAPVPDPPALDADSYVLMDHQTGRVLAEREPESQVEPASITKLMTAYIVFEELKNGDLDLSEEVPISERAWRMPGSRTFVEVDTKTSVETLLQGMIVQSGNDASVALAEHIAGTEASFAQLMNNYAQELGLEGTHYVNATGLPDPEHYTTARDIARLTRAVIRHHPDFYEWYSQKKFTYNGITQYNRNKLLWRMPSVDGVKTGHTESAGYCLVTSAERDGMRLISVVMGTDSEEARADANQALLNYGFRFYETRRLYAAGEQLTDAPVWKGAQDRVGLGLDRDLYVTFPSGRYDALSASMEIDARLMAPVEQGATHGSVHVKLDDETVAEAPLTALDSVPEGSLWQRLTDEVLLMFE